MQKISMETSRTSEQHYSDQNYSQNAVHRFNFNQVSEPKLHHNMPEKMNPYHQQNAERNRSPTQQYVQPNNISQEAKPRVLAKKTNNSAVFGVVTNIDRSHISQPSHPRLHASPTNLQASHPQYEENLNRNNRPPIPRKPNIVPPPQHTKPLHHYHDDSSGYGSGHAEGGSYHQRNQPPEAYQKAPQSSDSAMRSPKDWNQQQRNNAPIRHWTLRKPSQSSDDGPSNARNQSIIMPTGVQARKQVFDQPNPRSTQGFRPPASPDNRIEQGYGNVRPLPPRPSVSSRSDNAQQYHAAPNQSRGFQDPNRPESFQKPPSERELSQHSSPSYSERQTQYHYETQRQYEERGPPDNSRYPPPNSPRSPNSNQYQGYSNRGSEPYQGYSNRGSEPSPLIPQRFAIQEQRGHSAPHHNVSQQPNYHRDNQIVQHNLSPDDYQHPPPNQTNYNYDERPLHYEYHEQHRIRNQDDYARNYEQNDRGSANYGQNQGPIQEDYCQTDRTADYERTTEYSYNRRQETHPQENVVHRSNPHYEQPREPVARTYASQERDEEDYVPDVVRRSYQSLNPTTEEPHNQDSSRNYEKPKSQPNRIQEPQARELPMGGNSKRPPSLTHVPRHPFDPVGDESSPSSNNEDSPTTPNKPTGLKQKKFGAFNYFGDLGQNKSGRSNENSQRQPKLSKNEQMMSRQPGDGLNSDESAADKKGFPSEDSDTQRNPLNHDHLKDRLRIVKGGMTKRRPPTRTTAVDLSDRKAESAENNSNSDFEITVTANDLAQPQTPPIKVQKPKPSKSSKPTQKSKPSKPNVKQKTLDETTQTNLRTPADSRDQSNSKLVFKMPSDDILDRDTAHPVPIAKRVWKVEGFGNTPKPKHTLGSGILGQLKAVGENALKSGILKKEDHGPKPRPPPKPSADEVRMQKNAEAILKTFEIVDEATDEDHRREVGKSKARGRSRSLDRLGSSSRRKRSVSRDRHSGPTRIGRSRSRDRLSSSYRRGRSKSCDRLSSPNRRGRSRSRDRLSSPNRRGRSRSRDRLSSPNRRGRSRSRDRLSSPNRRGRSRSRDRLSSPNRRGRSRSRDRLSSSNRRGRSGSRDRLASPNRRGRSRSRDRLSSPNRRDRSKSRDRLQSSSQRGRSKSRGRMSSPIRRGRSTSRDRLQSPRARGRSKSRDRKHSPRRGRSKSCERYDSPPRRVRTKSRDRHHSPLRRTRSKSRDRRYSSPHRARSKSRDRRYSPSRARSKSRDRRYSPPRRTRSHSRDRYSSPGRHSGRDDWSRSSPGSYRDYWPPRPYGKSYNHSHYGGPADYGRRVPPYNDRDASKRAWVNDPRWRQNHGYPPDPRESRHLYGSGESFPPKRRGYPPPNDWSRIPPHMR